MRKHQLIHPAKAQDLQAGPSEIDVDYMTRINTALHESAMESKQHRTVTAPKMPTPPSQLSYKALTPKAAPLPPSLSLQRGGGHGRTGASPAAAASPAYSSRRASRASVFKSINQEGQITNLSTPLGSDRSAVEEMKGGAGSKPGSKRSTPRNKADGTPVGSKHTSPSGSKQVSPAASKHPSPGQSPKGRPSPKIGVSPAGSHRSTPKNSSPTSR